MEFSIQGKAEPAGSKKAFHNPKNPQHPIVTDDNRKAGPWKAEVKAAAMEAMRRRNGHNGLMEGPIQVAMTFIVPRPQAHFTSTGNPSAVAKRMPFPTVRPDLLKLARAIEDAMTGIVYRDDSQIVLERLQKVYGAVYETRVIVLPMPQ